MLFNVVHCVQFRQANTNIENCYMLVAFSLDVTAHQPPNIVLELGA